MKGTFDTKTIDQLLQFLRACNAVGIRPGDLAWLYEPDNLEKIIPVIRGNGKVEVTKHVIDLSLEAPTFGASLEATSHFLGGLIEWDPARIQLHAGEPVTAENSPGLDLNTVGWACNACMLNYLLAHQEIVPEELRGKRLFFDGTRYRSPGGQPCVRGMQWGEAVQEWGLVWKLNGTFASNDVSVCLL